MNNIQFKYTELLRKKDEVLVALKTGDTGLTLLSKFKEFCNICYTLKEWSGLTLSDLVSSIYIDICRGVSNGDKHYRIAQNLASYKSDFYRTSVSGDSSMIQSSTGGYVGDDSDDLYSDPGKDKLVVETNSGIYDLKSIVIGSTKDWERILHSNNLL